MKRPDIADEQGLRPLTAAQSLLWTGQELDPESPLYNMAVAFHIEGALDADLFAKAFQRLVDGSDALRTRFERTNDGPRRRIVESQTKARLRVREQRLIRHAAPVCMIAATRWISLSANCSALTRLDLQE